jgi:hypothetical protein
MPFLHSFWREYFLFVDPNQVFLASRHHRRLEEGAGLFILVILTSLGVFQEKSLG